MKNVIVILGPTGVGKSKTAIEVAKLLNGEIISADSMQIYKGLDIGTAKITPTQTEGVVHHMIDIKNFDQTYNVWQFVNDCKQILDDIISKGKLPIIVGGTNLYISALTQNYDFGKEEMPKDAYLAKNDYNFQLFALNLPREELYDRLNKRVDIMINAGLENEVLNLKNQGLNISMQAGKSIGYKEFLEYFEGLYSKDFAIDKIKQHNRNFAKRQLTWLRSMKDLIWLDASKLEENIQIIVKAVE